MPITLIWLTRRCTGNSGFARRNHHLDIGAMLRDRLVGESTIVGTIGDDFFDLFIGLRQQWPRICRDKGGRDRVVRCALTQN